MNYSAALDSFAALAVSGFFLDLASVLDAVRFSKKARMSWVQSVTCVSGPDSAGRSTPAMSRISAVQANPQVRAT